MESRAIETANFIFRPRSISGVVAIEPRRRPDRRGWLAEVYNASEFAAAGIRTVFVQENQSWSAEPRTMRGLHFLARRPVAKHLRVVAGRIFTACVDIRPGSPTFGRWDGCEMSAEGGEQVYIEPGFAHGICTLRPSTVIAYQLSGHHDPALERGLRWDDPEIDVAWPWPPEQMIVSPKDAGLPSWRELRRELLEQDEPV